MKLVFVFVGFVALSVVFSAILALPVMWLWNDVVVEVFKQPELTWMQAWGLSLLCSFLFKSNVSSK